jgi:LPS sulfotransferase NodH
MSPLIRLRPGLKHREALARTLLNIRSIRGTTSYTRFVIVGIARTGSTMLVSQLNSHSQALVFGEIFRSEDAIGWDFTPFRSYQNRRLRTLYSSDSIAFLDQHVFRRWPGNHKAVGFKLFYYHARTPSRRPVWDYLIDRPEIRILHIKRRNLLRQYASLQLAHATNIWSTTPSVIQDPQKLRLGISACQNHFTWVRSLGEECDTLFKNHKIKNIYYEDLVSDTRRELRDIQTFLGLRHETLVAQTVRQQTQPLSQVIVNYDELREAFFGTEWRSFFDDPTYAERLEDARTGC